VWEYHNYEGFTTADPVVDYLARFGVPTTIEEYAMQAQMAQFFQYQALFEGFQHHAFAFTSAVIFWKSQSPWPALRGAFYDHYLDTTGGFWGVRAACGEDVHAQLNQADRTLAVVSRRFAAVAGATMTASWYSMETGARLGEAHSVASILVHPNSVTRVGGTDAVPWPAEAKDTDVLMLRLGLTEPDGTTLSTNEYWLAREGDGTAVSVTAWGRFRHFHAESPPATLVVLATSTHPDAKNAIGITVTIRLAQSAAVGLMVRAQIATSDTALRRESDGVETDTRVLPVWWSHNYVSILPGEERVLTAECTAASPVAAPLYLRVDGYNVRPLVIRISSPTQA
jgi:mannosylglycoprotein endo-beta-mannosidase